VANSGKDDDGGFAVHDRRHWADGEDPGDESVEAPRADRPSYVAELEQRVESAESRLREYISARKVEQSDLQALRERLQREHALEIARARGRVVAEVLDLLDDLGRAEEAAREGGSLEALLEGVTLVHQQMLSRLIEMGLERIAALNTPFDPEIHEAVSVQPCDADQDGMVLQVLSEGYAFGDLVLRPARVIVGKAG